MARLERETYVTPRIGRVILAQIEEEIERGGCGYSVCRRLDDGVKDRHHDGDGISLDRVTLNRPQRSEDGDQDEPQNPGYSHFVR